MSYVPTRQEVYALVREAVEAARDCNADDVSMGLDVARELARRAGIELPQKRLSRIEQIAYEKATKDALARVEYYAARNPHEALISLDEAGEYIPNTGRAARRKLQQQLKEANRLMRPIKRELGYV